MFLDTSKELLAPADFKCCQLAKKTMQKELKTANERREKLKYHTHPNTHSVLTALELIGFRARVRRKFNQRLYLVNTVQISAEIRF